MPPARTLIGRHFSAAFRLDERCPLRGAADVPCGRRARSFTPAFRGEIVEMRPDAGACGPVPATRQPMSGRQAMASSVAIGAVLSLLDYQRRCPSEDHFHPKARQLDSTGDGFLAMRALQPRVP